MSTQFEGGAGDDVIERETGQSDNVSQCQTDDLRRLLERIADQLNTTDQRQAATLAQMLAGVEVHHHKTERPQEYQPALDRIKDGVSVRTDRIADLPGSPSDQWRAAADEPTQPAEPAAEPAHAIDPVLANDEAAWDQRAADALAAHYEQEFGTIAADIDDDAVDTDDSRMQTFAAVEMPQPERGSELPRDVRAFLLDNERNWLEEHFIDLARKVEDTLAQRSSDTALSGLGERFDRLEQRFGSAMHEVATRSDMEALHGLEAHISDLAHQFDETHNQLSRLDNIEHSLAAVIDRLTDPRFENALERSGAEETDLEHLVSAAVEQIAQRLHATQAPTPDLHGFAEDIAATTAELVASRISDNTPVRGEDSTSNVDAIRHLLDQFINERREGEEQTAVVLDTMQRALIRVLDRVDALESSHSRSTADYGRYTAEPIGARPLDSTAMAQGASKGPDATQAADYSPPERETAAQRSVESTPPVAKNHQPLHQPSSPASIERLRQEFIADARRAKEKAANAPVAPPVYAGATAPRVEVSESRGNSVKLEPRAEPVTAAAKDGTGIVSRFRTPSRKLLVGAIVLMIALPGVLLLLKKGQATAPTPVAIERSQAPGDRSIAPISPTKQTNAAAPLESDPAVRMPRAETPDAQAKAQDSTPTGSPSMPPKLPAAERPATGSGATPENKDDLYRSYPRTQSQGLDQDIEVPANLDELRDSRLPSDSLDIATPPAGITLATPRRAPSLAQFERLSERNATAQLSSQLGEAQFNAVPAALIPEFMNGEAKSNTAPAAPSFQASISDSHRQPLDLPPALVGPLSLRMAAASGNPSAEFAVAVRFADGTGIEQNLEEAVRWYQRSASHGFAQSQYRLATLYERGLGVKQDNARAKIWYQRAAENGNVKAMHNLAVLSAGRTAKVPDYKTAAQWFKTAAEHGLADSQFNLAVLHESGLGVEQDTNAAYFWFALSARNGDTEALRRQIELEKSIKPIELTKTKLKLDDWRPKQADRIANDPLAASEAWKAKAAADGAI